MLLDDDSCYRAITASDPRFDGAFFVGVSTTRIYCRSICPAKTPRRDRCTFFRTAAAAERAGYRPCLRCRPELAPGSASVDSPQRLAVLAARRIEDGALCEMSVSALAAEIGISDRHLRRAVESEYGVSPIEMAQTKRLLTAKQLLTDTQMSATDIAFASGFSSLRRFNALFRERYRLSPTDLRRKARISTSAVDESAITFRLAYRPPYDWEAIAYFLCARAVSGVEAVTEREYRRTVSLGKHRGWIAVRPSDGKNELRIDLSASLAPALLPVITRIKRLFDLSASPDVIASHLGSLAASRPGLRVPGSFDGFEIATRAILGQQVSVPSATTLAGRFAAAFGEAIETPYADLTLLTPTPDRIATLSIPEITELGIISKRAQSIIALAQTVTARSLILVPGADVETEIERMLSLPGVGPWTAQYIAMRVLAWPDAFPHTDLAIVKALRTQTPADALRVAEDWRPWRAYAAIHLWESLKVSAGIDRVAA